MKTLRLFFIVIAVLCIVEIIIQGYMAIWDKVFISNSVNDQILGSAIITLILAVIGIVATLPEKK